MEIGPFALGEWFVARPRRSPTGIGMPVFQFDTALMLGLRPMPKLARSTTPRLGISYGFAGAISGWRFVIGEPL